MQFTGALEGGCNEIDQEATGRTGWESISFEIQENHLWLYAVLGDSGWDSVPSAWQHCFSLVQFILLLFHIPRTSSAPTGPRYIVATTENRADELKATHGASLLYSLCWSWNSMCLADCWCGKEEKQKSKTLVSHCLSSSPVVANSLAQKPLGRGLV